MKTIEFVSAQNVKVEYELASIGQRTLASVIDVVAFLIYFIAFSTILGLTNIFNSSIGSSIFVSLLLIKIPWIFYNPIIEHLTNGQSLGKYIMGIRVVTVNGERVGFREVFTRWIFKGDFIWISADFLILFWFGIGLLGIIFGNTSERKQRLGDVMANTVVIKLKTSIIYSLKDVLSIKTQENYVPIYPKVVQFTDEDMLLIKSTIQRVRKYPNKATKDFAIELANKSAILLGLEETPAKRMEFLQILLQDYIVLTR
jgi:uncharacterized RDD family membrane protein YckC